MSNPATVIAAGGVVWREHRGTRQVLLVHRPRYDDWSLPKGKLTTHEHVLLAASATGGALGGRQGGLAAVTQREPIGHSPVA